MRASPTNVRSLVIGTLLAVLSAGCLIAFTLVAGSTDYPSMTRVQAADPPDVAAPVTLSARPDRDEGRTPRIVPDEASDPSEPIVLGIQVPKTDAQDDDRDRKPKPSGRTPKKDPGKPSDKDPGGGSPPRVAKPIAEPETEIHVPRGHAYGHEKKAKWTGPPATSSSSSPRNGPPAHATATGHNDSSGPPAHASANGHSEGSGPPAHASANGHEKKPKK